MKVISFIGGFIGALAANSIGILGFLIGVANAMGVGEGTGNHHWSVGILFIVVVLAIVLAVTIGVSAIAESESATARAIKPAGYEFLAGVAFILVVSMGGGSQDCGGTWPVGPLCDR